MADAGGLPDGMEVHEAGSSRALGGRDVRQQSRLVLTRCAGGPQVCDEGRNAGFYLKGSRQHAVGVSQAYCAAAGTACAAGRPDLLQAKSRQQAADVADSTCLSQSTAHTLRVCEHFAPTIHLPTAAPQRPAQRTPDTCPLRSCEPAGTCWTRGPPTTPRCPHQQLCSILSSCNSACLGVGSSHYFHTPTAVTPGRSGQL